LEERATGIMPLFLTHKNGGGQNIQKKEVFAAARQDVGPFSFYFLFSLGLIFLDLVLEN
jgi:hypothetical protein